ncbi:hypothetical protein LCM20_03205 [Halobacillus litoralis]|uniref:hypothetical protein n=1 Tax=Halobacillus litoralis TaxID=45668 RepID=UPI001CD38E67|nr:hypothetical protein [Halobacillus litoralis]MCA0969599.1 hypothetical protein [Halobacillus litoralis]
MADKKMSPFDQFWNRRPAQEDGSQKEEKKEEATDSEDTSGSPSLSWPDLMQEMSKTWKSVSPIVKPMIDKFKK